MYNIEKVNEELNGHGVVIEGDVSHETYDKAADMGYLYIDGQDVKVGYHTSVEVGGSENKAPKYVLDVDKDGKVLGVEVYNPRARGLIGEDVETFGYSDLDDEFKETVDKLKVLWERK